MVQQVDYLSFFTRHMSLDRFSAAMLASWEYNNMSLSGPAVTSLTIDALRQRLRKTWMAYQYLQGLVEDYPDGLPGWPSGAVNGCPACGDAPAATNVVEAQGLRRRHQGVSVQCRQSSTIRG